MSKIQIKNRRTGNVLFEHELSAEMEGASHGVKLGLAVRAEHKSDADLRGADLRFADLSDAVLRSVPVIHDIHQAVYAAASAEGALEMETWHSECGTAHCRAGWVVHLAGKAGRDLEARVGTGSAAALIYLASDPTIECVPSWYASNEEALSDMQRLAELEASRNAEPPATA